MNAVQPARPLGQPAQPIDMVWFLPTGGDGRYLGSAEGARPVDNRYLRQIAQATDQLGYHGVLLPTGAGCEDALVTAASCCSRRCRRRIRRSILVGPRRPGTPWLRRRPTPI